MSDTTTSLSGADLVSTNWPARYYAAYDKTATAATRPTAIYDTQSSSIVAADLPAASDMVALTEDQFNMAQGAPNVWVKGGALIWPDRYYASYDTTAAQPTPVRGWYDTWTLGTESATEPPSVIPVASDMVVVSASNWNDKTFRVPTGKWVDGGEVIDHTPSATLASQTAALSSIAATKQAAGVYYTPSAGTTAYLFGTDDASQTKILTAFVSANAGLWVDGTVWKTSSGTFVAMTSADVIALAKASQSYVAACYAREHALQTALASDLSTDLTTGWPSQGAAT